MNWHREAVGGMWDEIGCLQLVFLHSAGLRPEHTLLDVGCGSLRGGARFISYLDEGNYVGLDKNGPLVTAGIEIELPKSGANGKRFRTIINSDFDLSGYEGAFDFALAQSLFTHLRRDEIKACMGSVCDALSIGGRFYATHFAAPRPQHTMNITHWPGGVVTHLYTDPFHQEVEFYEELVSDLPLTFLAVGDWDHPRSQKMLEFTKEVA